MRLINQIKNSEFFQEFSEQDRLFPIYVVIAVGLVLFLINLCYTIGCAILYIRMAGQNCIPDGGFWEYLNITPLIIFSGICLLVVYFLVNVGIILSMKYVGKAVSRAVKPISHAVKLKTSWIPAANLAKVEKSITKISLIKPSRFWNFVDNLFMWIYFICMGLLILGIIVCVIHMLFFDDPCQHLN